MNLINAIDNILRERDNDEEISNLNYSNIEPSNLEPLNPDEFVHTIDDFGKKEWIKLRTKYANKLFILLSTEIGLTFIIIFLIGIKYLSIPQSTLNISIIAITIHTFALVKEIVRNLFPNT